MTDTYLDRMIAATMKSIPGYFKPEIFDHSTLKFRINGPQTGTDPRGNPVYTVTEVILKAILYKKPRINKVIQRLDKVSSFDIYEGNIIDPPDNLTLLQNEISKAEGEIIGEATINGVEGRARLVTIGRGYLKAYNRYLGRVVQVEFIGGKINV